MMQNLLNRIQKLQNEIVHNATQNYLVLANSILIVFSIWFSNAELIPFKNVGDFLVFVAFGLIFAIYRPAWSFLLFVGMLPLENISLAPAAFGIALKPYQFFLLITATATAVQILTKRLTFSLPKFEKIDWIPILFVAGSFVSTLFAANHGIAFKQSVVAVSFVAIYFLVRIFIQSFDDLKKNSDFFY